MNLFRRLPLYRLLLLCGVASPSVSAPPRWRSRSAPAPRHRGRSRRRSTTRSAAAAPEGFSANVQLTDHLLEGASLASEGAGGPGGGGGELTSSPLVDGRLGAHLDLQGRQVPARAAVRTGRHGDRLRRPHARALRRRHEHALPLHPAGARRAAKAKRRPQPGVPSVAKIQEAIDHGEARAPVRQASPPTWAAQPAYTVSALPRGRRQPALARSQLSFDAENGVPLRAAVYSIGELLAGARTGGERSVLRRGASSVFELQPPASAKVQEVKRRREARRRGARPTPSAGTAAHRSRVHGQGPGAIAVLEAGGSGTSSGEGGALNGLPHGEDRRRQGERAAHGARHGAQLRARRRALPARGLGQAGRAAGARKWPLARAPRRGSRPPPSACGRSRGAPASSSRCVRAGW